MSTPRAVGDTGVAGDAPREARRPDVERRLIAAVSRLCGDGTPFADLTVSQIVREAGLGRATFYLYFADRSAFVQRLADHVGQQLAGPVAVLWGAALEDREVLQSALSDFVSIYAREFPVIAAVVATASSDAVVADLLAANLQTFITQSAQVLEAAQGRGVVRGNLPAYELAASLVWMVERSCYQMARGNDPDALARLSQTLATIAWHSLHE